MEVSFLDKVIRKYPVSPPNYLETVNAVRITKYILIYDHFLSLYADCLMQIQVCKVL